MAALAISLTILAIAASFHLHWAFGGRYGFSVSLPQRPDGRPIYDHLLPLWRIGALFVALGLIGIGLLALDRAEVMRTGLDRELVTAVLALVGVAFVARALAWHRYVGVFKTLRTTRWARYDTRFYCPLFFSLGVSLVALATG